MKKLTRTVKTSSQRDEFALQSTGLDFPQVQIQSLVNVLTSLKKEDNTPLVNYDQALALTNLKFETGDNILTLEDRPFVYEIINMLHTLGYEIVYNFLSVGWEKVLGSYDLRKRILFENPLLNKPKSKMDMDMEIYRNKIDVGIGAVNCPRCHSQETMSVEKQTRSADEQTTVRCTCLMCKYKWTAQ